MNSEQLEGAKKLFFILLGIDIVATAIVGFNAFATVGTLREVQTGARNIDQSMINSLAFWDGFSKLLFLTLIGVGFGLVKWLNACYSFAKRAIGATGFKNEGWTAAGWIIPIFNLFKPYQIINEIYKAGSNEYVAPDGWKKESGSGALLTWWIFWAVTHFIFWIISKQLIRTAFRDDITIPQAIELTVLQAWLCMTSLVIAGLWFWVAKLLTQRMLERNAILANATSGQCDIRTSNHAPTSRPVATPIPAATETPTMTTSERREAAVDIPEVSSSGLTIPIPTMLESDDWAFEKVADEFETSSTDKVLWTRVFAESGGEENKAKALYIQRRVVVIVEAEKKRLAEEYARAVETQRQLDEHDELERMRALEVRRDEDALAKVEREKFEADAARQDAEQERNQQIQKEASFDKLGSAIDLLSTPKQGISIGATIVVALGITAVLIVGLVSLVAPDTRSKSTSTATASTPALPSQVHEIAPSQSKEQQDLLTAAQEIIARFPQLNIESPNKDQVAIDFVVRIRDGYVARGHAIDIALRMAANDYAEELQRQAQQRSVTQTTATRNQLPSAQGKPVLTWYEKQEQRRKCNIQPVMTDAELDACR